MIRMIAAVSINGIIGIDNNIPWIGKYPDDMKFFRTMTKNSIVVMGRKTFSSMAYKPLPKRENRIVSSSRVDSVGYDNFSTLEAALSAPNPNASDVWLIGGSGIYEAGLTMADEIYTTLIPGVVDTNGKSVARFPYMHPLAFDCEKRMMSEIIPEAGEQKLIVAIYRPSKTKWY